MGLTPIFRASHALNALAPLSFFCIRPLIASDMQHPNRSSRIDHSGASKEAWSVTSRTPDMQWDQSGLTVESAVIAHENK